MGKTLNPTHLSWTVREDINGSPFDVVYALPHYSANIADAWQVVEHLRAQHIYLIRLTNGVTNYACWLGRGVSVDGVQAVGDTAPEAICRAALMVAEYQRKEGNRK